MPIIRKDLKNKPLVEAILELKWGLKSIPTHGFVADPNYRILLGRFSEYVKAEYPAHEALPTASVPDQMVEKMAQHRFRVKADQWPLLQVGPGLLTVNEASGYTWTDFKVRCETAIKHLLKAYPEEGGPKVEEITLWYIDAVECDYKSENVFNFLREKLKVKIHLPEALFSDIPVENNPSSFRWEVSYPLKGPKGRIRLRLGTGLKGGALAVIWETLVVSKGNEVPNLEDFGKWLIAAHEATDDWFFKLIEGDLEKRFSGE